MKLRTLPGVRVLCNRITRTLLFVALAVYAYLGALTPMEADDFCQASDALTYGIVGSTLYTYETWQGRYSQMTLSSILYVVFRDSAPAVSAILIVGAAALTAFWVWGDIGWLLVVAFLLALQGYIWQAVYWMPGGITYTLPFILAVILAHLATKRAPSLTLFVLALITAGFNETIGLLLIGAAVLYNQRALGAGALIGVLVLFAAPGNVIRNSYLPHIGILEMGTRTLSFLAQWGIILLLNAPAALLGAFVAGMARPSRLDKRLVLVTLAALFSLAATVNLAGGTTDRAWVAPTAGLIGLCFHAGQVYGQGNALNRQLHATAIVLLLIAVIAFAKPNLFHLALVPDARSQMFAQLASIDTTQAWIAPCQEQLQSLTNGDARRSS